MNHSPEIKCLRSDLEQRVGQQLQSPADFQLLIQQIWEKKHAVLSLSTIKRLEVYNKYMHKRLPERYMRKGVSNPILYQSDKK